MSDEPLKEHYGCKCGYKINLKDIYYSDVETLPCPDCGEEIDLVKIFKPKWGAGAFKTTGEINE